MFERFGRFISIAVFLFLFSGCAGLNGSVPFRYQPSPFATTEKIDKTIGLNMLVDKRPKGDIAYTKSIKDIPGKITSKLLEDLAESRLFKEIHFPAQPGDDIIINGTIDRFIWRLRGTPIPVLNLILYSGVPAYGITGVTLEIKNNRTGAIIGKLEESARVESSYTLFTFKRAEAGVELEKAFRDMGTRLKGDLLTKLTKPQEAAK